MQPGRQPHPPRRPAGPKTEHRYEDRFNQVTRRFDPDGATFAYEYDSGRNLVALVNQNNERYTLEYDAAGNLAQIEDLKGTTTFRNDPLDHRRALRRRH